ncbi:hypothetical protein H4R33_000869 [Dimargaris cristalligena]|uniref:Peptidase C15, pyroglutamyl peptidase I-like protein n=1 Tax=Dimargaris cristalligena TaxID=215637 RepID=A0A4V1J589_9FUNG|nr:hypothetical protein H4R33_000869 [Dimargaris cristalligena]RKP38219.1 hypothetical protein BJ085DRAFT_29058 [Dimargaris cristalligena]|eukprot:RKP38219.1 hypothetical protein BJ085DRAFT_29058 [Dimargaris cristalligena]
MSTPRKNILITGFEPFGTPRPATNSSWEAIKGLEGLEIPVFHGGKLSVLRVHVHRLPVEYDGVLQAVRDLHLPTEGNSPHYDFYIHVGQAKPDQCALEQFARRTGYVRADNHGKSLPDQQCPPLGGEPMPTRFESTVSVAGLAQYLRDVCQQPLVHASNDAGLYLCEFTYYVSMYYQWQHTRAQGQHLTTPEEPPSSSSVPVGNVLFIHIPPENQPMSLDQSRALILSTLQWVGQEMPTAKS